MTNSKDAPFRRAQGPTLTPVFFSGSSEIWCFADRRGDGRNSAGLGEGFFHFAHTSADRPRGFHSRFHMVQTVLSAAGQHVLRGGL